MHTSLNAGMYARGIDVTTNKVCGNEWPWAEGLERGLLGYWQVPLCDFCGLAC